MSLENDNRKLVVRYLVCWGVLLASLVLFPTLAWLLLPSRMLPDAVGQVLLFWPQYLFLPQGIARDAMLEEHARLEDGAALAAAVFWAVAIAAYVRVTRSLRAAVVYAALLPAVLVVLQAVLGLLGLFGFGIVLDGP